ncbi:rhomboid-domain-containing protein [Rickenella mellea]|uniref:Rhomboid-domain-containing protein n=1 Tax=Rickenella mellea TaxID=50990 RepID=A0A4R5XE19_9AGAM|nr:rhomboid-domain-containing protein [Rickenella mellea]
MLRVHCRPQWSLKPALLNSRRLSSAFFTSKLPVECFRAPSISSHLNLSRWYDSKNRALSRTRSRTGTHREHPSSDPKRGTSWLDKIPHNVIVYGILGINGAVYLAWQYAESRRSVGDPSLSIFLSKNLLMAWGNIQQGRIWTVLTSSFSHSTAGHIFMNAFTFYFMAPPVIRFLGNASFLRLYLGGGIIGSIVSLLANKSVRERGGASHGASAAIYSVVTFFACAAPTTTFYFFGVLPVPAWMLVSGLFVWDGLSTLSDRRTRTDGAGHVGGMLAGAAYFFMKSRGVRGL